MGCLGIGAAVFEARLGRMFWVFFSVGFFRGFFQNGLVEGGNKKQKSQTNLMGTDCRVIEQPDNTQQQECMRNCI